MIHHKELSLYQPQITLPNSSLKSNLAGGSLLSFSPFKEEAMLLDHAEHHKNPRLS